MEPSIDIYIEGLCYNFLAKLRHFKRVNIARALLVTHKFTQCLSYKLILGLNPRPPHHEAHPWTTSGYFYSELFKKKKSQNVQMVLA